jgi:hypothetical protein
MGDSGCVEQTVVAEACVSGRKLEILYGVSITTFLSQFSQGKDEGLPSSNHVDLKRLAILRLFPQARLFRLFLDCE